MHRKRLSLPLRGLLLIATLLSGIVFSASADDAYLGVQTQRLNEALMEAFELDEGAGGVLVNDVMDDSPAAAAGLKAGDLIISIDGKDLSSPNGLLRRIRSYDAGDKVTIDLIRRGSKMSVDVELGEFEENVFYGDLRGHRGRSAPHHEYEMQDKPGMQMLFLGEGRPRLGVSLHALDDDLGEYFESDRGMLVLDVHEDSPAEDAGIQAGDVIVAAEGEDIGEIDDLHGVLEDHEAGDRVELSIIRRGKPQDVEVELGEAEHLTQVFDEMGSLHRRWSGEGPHFEIRRPRGENFRFAPRVERHRLHESRGDEIEELREELEALRRELEELRDQ